MKSKRSGPGRFRLMIALVAVVAAGVGVAQMVDGAAAASSASSSPAANPFSGYTPPVGPELSVASIVNIALAESQKDGTAAPTGVSVEEGTLRTVMTGISPEVSLPVAPGGGQEAWLNSTVAVVTMHGNFTLVDAHVPPGAGTPTGSTLDIVIDTHSGEVVERSLPVAAMNLQHLTAVPLESGDATIASRVGILAGHLYVGGGPALSPPRTVPARHAASGYRVVVREMAGTSTNAVARTTTRRNGSFTIRLRPGRYQVAGEFNTGKLCFVHKVTVRAGKTTTVNLECGAK
jgi:hypothetical protein